MVPSEVTPAFPTPLSDYPAAGASLADTLSARFDQVPFNGVATAIFVLAILHTFGAARIATWSHHVQHRFDERLRTRGQEPRPSVLAELLHFFGEVEAVFGLWAVVLLVAITGAYDWGTAKEYFSHTVNYTEPLFVVVIMALAATRPIVGLAESMLRVFANLGGGTAPAWWVTILTIGPLLGSFITEPAAMTICALLLGRQFYDLQPSQTLKYATLGLLFVNVSIGGTLTHFAAPPVLMVARPWGWDTAFMLSHFGWHAVLSIVVSTSVYFFAFRREMRALAKRPPKPDIETPEPGQDVAGPGMLPVPWWLTTAHVGFMAWTVFNSHYPALFIGGFLFFLGFAIATQPYQSAIELKSPLLVGFFLGGLVIHGGLQGWWIAPALESLSETPLFFGAAVLTAFNDNALITYLATLVPNLSDGLKYAVVAGAVTGGGLTVIANAPNPAGQSLLRRFFGGAISPVGLFGGALVPTLITSAVFVLL